MGRVNDQITFAAIPADVQQQIVVVKAGEERARRSSIRTRSRRCRPTSRTVVLDAQKEGAKWSFRYVSALPVLLVLIFGAIALSDRARGGYKPEVLTGKEMAPAELASDY